MSKEERGFGLVEVLVSVALVLVASLAALMLVRVVANVLPTQLAEPNRSLQRQIAALQSDATTANAVFAPNPKEVDFFSLTNSADGRVSQKNSDAPRAGLYWKYVYDSERGTLRRYDYVPGGAVGRRTLNGGIDPSASYPPQTGVLHFQARTFSADRLADMSNAYAPALQGLAVRAFPVNVGGPGVTGGNQVTEVVLVMREGTRRVHLLSGTMPSGFTLVGAAMYKAVVYRQDLTHRFFFGLAGKTHVEIRARVYVSYDRWKTRAPWCDYGIYRDTHTAFSANDPLEQPQHIASVCEGFKFPLPPSGADGRIAGSLQPRQAPPGFFDGGVGNGH